MASYLVPKYPITSVFPFFLIFSIIFCCFILILENNQFSQVMQWILWADRIQKSHEESPSFALVPDLDRVQCEDKFKCWNGCSRDLTQSPLWGSYLYKSFRTIYQDEKGTGNCPQCVFKAPFRHRHWKLQSMRGQRTHTGGQIACHMVKWGFFPGTMHC